MSLTGLILWFPIFFQGNYAPGWTIKVSEIIHYYEAILATLAIIIWHFFFVIFSPDEYPLNFAMTDGKMDVDHYRKHHRKIFNHLILDWFMVKKGKRDSINDLTQSLVDSIQSKGKPEDEFFHQEIANDSDLKHWINSKLGI